MRKFLFTVFVTSISGLAFAAGDIKNPLGFTTVCEQTLNESEICATATLTVSSDCYSASTSYTFCCTEGNGTCSESLAVAAATNMAWTRANALIDAVSELEEVAPC